MKDFIELFRKNGFNCFPLVRYREGETNTKKADHRWKGRRTIENMPIRDDENYGMCGTINGKNGIIDLDNKELYRKFVNNIITKGVMVIETGNGWHIPVKGFSSETEKIELFDYAVQDKKIVEFQGPDHYVIGAGCEIWHETLQHKVTYCNVGSDEIWDVRGKDFHAFIDMICNELGLIPKKKNNTSSYKYLRDNFRNGKIPKTGQSNDYFHQAAIVCLSDGLTVSEALEKIKIIYNKWEESEYYSNRTWSSIVSKIQYSYDHDTPLKEGRPIGGGGKIDIEKIVDNILSNRKMYSDIELGIIFENVNGFLENKTKSLQREIQSVYTMLRESEYNDIIFKIKGRSPPIPKTNKDTIVFKNGIVSKSQRKMIQSDGIADIGFINYNYLDSSSDNEPSEFLKIAFGGIPEDQHKIVKAGLKAILKSRMDPKISVIHGRSAVGKSTLLTILGLVLGSEYSFSTTVSDFITDRATRSNIKNKLLLIFQDMPETIKDFDIIKSVAGEINQNIRGFNEKNSGWLNKLKIWGSCNDLPEIPEKHRDAMFTQRLSLITNTRTIPFEPNDSLAEDIAESEGEKIISWLVNLDEKDCEYEHKSHLSKRWMNIQSPELLFLDKWYEISENMSEIPVSRIMIDYKNKTGEKITMLHLTKILKNEGYSIKSNIILNIKDRDQNPPQKNI